MTDTLLKQPSLRLLLFRLLEDGSSLVGPLLLFGGVLSLPTSLWLGEAARYDFWGFGVAIALIYYFDFRLKSLEHHLGRALSLSALLITFALPLAHERPLTLEALKVLVLLKEVVEREIE